MFFSMVLSGNEENYSRDDRARSERLEDFLACPVCHGELTYAKDTMRCGRCGGLFSYRNGMPVFTITERRARREPMAMG
jgi:uncharacterized protein YbaR (Trm112 family)